MTQGYQLDQSPPLRLFRSVFDNVLFEHGGHGGGHKILEIVQSPNFPFPFLFDLGLARIGLGLGLGLVNIQKPQV